MRRSSGHERNDCVFVCLQACFECIWWESIQMDIPETVVWVRFSWLCSKKGGPYCHSDIITCKQHKTKHYVHSNLELWNFSIVATWNIVKHFKKQNKTCILQIAGLDHVCMMTTRGHISAVPRSDAHLIAPTGTRGKTISIMRSGMNKRQVGKGILILLCYLKTSSRLIAGTVKL